MCLCCTTLRGVTYFMVNVHMLGAFLLGTLSIHTYFFRSLEIPPGLEDVNPIFIKNFPLLFGGYAAAAALFSCFIYRAIDMESLFQLTWSVVSFGGFQFLVIFLHFIFTVTFRDLVALQWQILMITALFANFTATIVYLTTLFLFGKKIHSYKYNQSIRNSIGNNLPIHSASSGVKKQNKNKNNGIASNPNPDMNLLENHPPVSRTNSVCKGTSTAEDEDVDLQDVTVERLPPPPPPPVGIPAGTLNQEVNEQTGGEAHAGTQVDSNNRRKKVSVKQDSPPPSYPNA